MSSLSSIQVKRQGGGESCTDAALAPSASSLKYGELACASNGDLYVRNGSGNVVGIITTNGNKTISGPITVNNTITATSISSQSATIGYITGTCSTAQFLRNNSGGQLCSWTSSLTDNNSTGRSWYGFGTYTGPDGYGWLNISDYWGINITTRDNSHLQHNGNILLDASNYGWYCLPLSGGTMTGNITLSGRNNQIVKNGVSTNWIWGRDVAALRINTAPGWHTIISLKTASGSWDIGEYNESWYANRLLFSYCPDANYNSGNNTTTLVQFGSGGQVYGAVYNDYAEYRQSKELTPGRCVTETLSGELVLSTSRLQPGGNIISDTYGFAIGETDKSQTPIAVCGRVLAFPFEDKIIYEPGDAVCTGPNGTVSKMSREEIREYPERIVGTVSEIPEYEEWVTEKVKVNGRIWIKVK